MTDIPAGFEHITNPQNGYGQGPQIISVADGLEVLCGPLLNYKGMHPEGGSTYWLGSVLLVTKPGQKHPKLQLRSLGPWAGGNTSGSAGASSHGESEVVEGLKLYADSTKAFWRFTIQVPLNEAETKWEYTIPDMNFHTKLNTTSPSRTFVVPATHESMRIMFHSCNGFSVGTDEDFWSGPALWNDVLRVYEKKPFHVMIGGGDQVRSFLEQTRM